MLLYPSYVGIITGQFNAIVTIPLNQSVYIYIQRNVIRVLNIAYNVSKLLEPTRLLSEGHVEASSKYKAVYEPINMIQQ